MGGLGCAPKVRQSRPGAKTGLPGQRLPLLRQNGPKMVQVRQRLPLLRQNGPKNGPSAPEPPPPGAKKGVKGPLWGPQR